MFQYITPYQSPPLNDTRPPPKPYKPKVESEMDIDDQEESTWPPPPGALLWASTMVYQIFGSNTDVGKTVFSTILCKCTSEYDDNITTYLKPMASGGVGDEQCKY